MAMFAGEDSEKLWTTPVRSANVTESQEIVAHKANTENRLDQGRQASTLSPAGVLALQRLAGNKAVSAYVQPGGSAGLGSHGAPLVVQRAVNKKGTFLNWGGTNDGSVFVNANAAVDVIEGGRSSSYPAWFGTEAVESVEVGPGARGTIVLRLPWYWHHHGIVKELGRFYGTNEKHIKAGDGPIDYFVSAPFVVAEDGKVVFPSGGIGSGTLGAVGYLDGTAVITPNGGDLAGSLTVSVTFRALQSTATTDTQTRSTTTTGTGSLTGTAAPGGIGGGATGGASYAVSESLSHAVGMTLTGTTAVTCSFGINLKVKMPPKIVKKQQILYDREGKFLSGNAGILGANDWWRSIPAPVREQIAAGQKAVRIQGRASKTGTAQQNELVIARRIADVKARLHNVASGMKIVDDSAFTDLDERSVLIWVEYTAADEKAPVAGP